MRRPRRLKIVCSTRDPCQVARCMCPNWHGCRATLEVSRVEFFMTVFFMQLSKRETCIVGGVSPFAKMQDKSSYGASPLYLCPHGLDVY
jgi:hypothetical protein